MADAERPGEEMLDIPPLLPLCHLHLSKELISLLHHQCALISVGRDAVVRLGRGGAGRNEEGQEG